MKLISKFILVLLVIKPAFSRQIYVVTYKENNKIVRLLRNELDPRFPKGFVAYIQSNKPCEKKYTDSLLHICVKGEKDFIVMNVNNEVMKTAMNIFKR